MSLISRSYARAKLALTSNWKEVDGQGSNPLILACYKSVDDLGIDEYQWNDSNIPWCSCFVNFIVQACGGRGTRSGMAASWLHWGKKSSGLPGDIVVLSRSGGHHVAFLISKGLLTVKLLGGNQADNLTISDYSKLRVVGYRTSLDVV